MQIKPSFDEFKKYAKKGNLIPVYVDVLADQLTPVSLLASGWDRNQHCFLLESVEGGEKLGRYSIVSFEPEAILKEKNGESTFSHANGQVFLKYTEPGLDSLRRYMNCVKPVNVPGVPRFYGGAVGYSSYETIRSIERIPNTKPDLMGWATNYYLITGDLFIFDNTQQTLKVVSCARLKNPQDAARAYKQAVSKIKSHLNYLKTIRRSMSTVKSTGYKSETHYRTNFDKKSYMNVVKKSREFIAKGDIIQVVLSRRNEKKTSASPLDIYRCLRVVNPSPYMFVMKLNDRAVIGSSPESLVRLEEGLVSTRPIAGTRRRGQNEAHDQQLADELSKDPKEIAEHIMLVDLGRNDLGRVCEYNSVKVPTFMKVERYSHVMHLVSEVVGKLKPSNSCFDLLKAVFPAGTVSGAPKIRAMEIIDELEDSQRGLYAGCIGYISYSGNMDMAITIRTILWKDGVVSIQTGAGLVADSIPAKEFDETENKAAALKETIRMAESRELFSESV